MLARRKLSRPSETGGGEMSRSKCAFKNLPAYNSKFEFTLERCAGTCQCTATALLRKNAMAATRPGAAAQKLKGHLRCLFDLFFPIKRKWAGECLYPPKNWFSTGTHTNTFTYCKVSNANVDGHVWFFILNSKQNNTYIYINIQLLIVLLIYS